ncbi:glycosyl transferase family 90-domain-containing protein [Aspergillus coremiiformis]|uniref:Glycosyl transferase family 90-domain-containing protein n=1 Tax=Aspergillus coremiiformis TaxID=138285 RepID=A0A5N6Z5T2_9EURO|nr:glycosyl transferase family 90-domain-containing protein [Aspergillus coremiiformis]
MRWSQGHSTRLRFLGTGAVCSLIAVTFLIFSTRYSAEVAKYALKAPVKQPPFSSPPQCRNDSSWEFEADRDGNNHGLSEEQCHSAFPKLFVEINKSASFREGRPIQFKDVDSLPVEDGMVRGIINRGELYIVDFGTMPATFTRGKATLNSLQRALASFPDRDQLPNIEFVFTTEDYSNGEGPIWSYSKRDEDHNVWLMPDFAYWSWPEVKIGSYKEVRRRIAAVDDGEVTVDGRVIPGLPFQDKKRQLAWRGSVATNPQVRGKLLKAAQGRSWASIRVIDWDDENDIRFNLLPMEDHCKYMFLAHTEGRSFSGRGKYLLNCRSVMISHKLVWREAHHGALISTGPDANYVEVERDFSDLDRKIEFLIDNPEVAERIANNTVKTFRDRYLTPAAESCYWRHLIRQYASSSDFEPVLYTTQEDGKMTPRGTPFETWVLTS